MYEQKEYDVIVHLRNREEFFYPIEIRKGLKCMKKIRLHTNDVDIALWLSGEFL